MALRIRPLAARLGKLSIRLSQTSSVRFNQTAAAAATSTTTTGPPPPSPSPEKMDAKAQAKAAKAEEKRIRKREKELLREREKQASQFPPGYGEKIYIFSHFLEGLTAYSHGPVLKATSALRQMPFNGKKMKPSKLRKDYWRAVAMLQFPEGRGDVGRSVYARLRECKRLHETAWDDSVLYDVNTHRTLKRIERGRTLNNQRGNAIADVAAVLGGLGKGNKMWVDVSTIVEAPAAAAEEGKEGEEGGSAAAAVEEGAAAGEKEASAGEEKLAAGEKEGAIGQEEATVSEGGTAIEEATASEDVAVFQEGAVGVPEAEVVKIKTKGGEVKALFKVSIWWANELDRNYATSWPANVTHHLFNEADLEPLSLGGQGPPKPDEDEGEGGETSQEAPTAEDEIRKEYERRRASF